MIEEAILDDLFDLIANQTALEIHIMKLIADKVKEENEEELKKWIAVEDSIRKMRQEDGRKYLGIPEDFKSEKFRTVVGEMGCAFKHCCIGYMINLEIVQKYCRMFAEEKDEEKRKDYIRMALRHIRKAKIYKSLANNIKEEIRKKLSEEGKNE